MDEAQAEKTIARCIQTIHANYKESTEIITSIDNALNNVAYKEEEKVDPGIKAMSPKEPQNITEALEMLVERGNALIYELKKLSRRTQKLF